MVVYNRMIFFYFSHPHGIMFFSFTEKLFLRLQVYRCYLLYGKRRYWIELQLGN